MLAEVKRAMPYSKCGEKRLTATLKACRHVDRHKIAGAFVECGVWKGGNLMIARWTSPDRQCWGYDTFAGMTEPGPFDMKRNGEKAGQKWIGKSSTRIESVMNNLERESAYDAKFCKFIIGDVRKTLLTPKNIPEAIAVLRLDTDFYDSTKAEMEILYPRLSIGGVLLIDDYGHWLGCRKAVDDYFGKSRSLLKMIDETGAWMVKQ